MDRAEVFRQVFDTMVFHMGMMGGAVFRRLTFREMTSLPCFGASLSHGWQN